MFAGAFGGLAYSALGPHLTVCSPGGPAVRRECGIVCTRGDACEVGRVFGLLRHGPAAPGAGHLQSRRGSHARSAAAAVPWPHNHSAGARAWTL